eukprot:gene27521-34249_t
MKHVGGPYKELFEGLLGMRTVYAVVFNGVHDKDREKLGFLMDTWSDRHFLSSNLLAVLKAQLTQPITISRSVPQNNFPMNPPIAMSVMVGDWSPANRNDLVQNDMIGMLHQMYADLNREARAAGQADLPQMSLDELYQVNNDLWNTLRMKAEENIDALQNNRQNIPQQQHQQQFQQQRINQQTSRQSDLQFYQQNNRQGSSFSSSFQQNQNLGKRQFPENNNQSQQQNRRVNQPREAHPLYVPPPARQQQQRQFQQRQQHQQSGSRFNSRSDDHFQDQHGGGSSSGRSSDNYREDNFGRDKPAHNVDQFGRDLPPPVAVAAFSPLDRLYVNGFICETPVVIDADRAQALSSQLACNYRETEPVMSAAFVSVARRVTRRMDMYLADIFSPPQLPQILFGALPLEPVLRGSEAQGAKSSSAMSGVTSSGGGDGGAQREKPKLRVPPFRADELGRNPDGVLRALYGDRKFQFHEDGLRFTSALELKQHTDEYLERKKGLQKKKDAQYREYREWYCSSAQWVSDFNALSLSGGNSASGVSGERESGVITSSASNAPSALSSGVEFIVPADEHFPRCPVSKEMFETFFDEEEGEMMFRNAAKVLVTSQYNENNKSTQGGGRSLYESGKDTEDTSVKYLIVHKLLVLDSWLSLGQAVTLQDAISRYQMSLGGGAMVESLRRAAGSDESEEDVFVLL